MRSTPLALLTAASLCVAAPASAQNPDILSPSNQPLPGLSEEADQQLWCAVMASQLAQVALQTTFVVLHFGEPDIRSYLDLYTVEISAVIAGTAPERYAPEQCKGIVPAMVMI